MKISYADFKKELELKGVQLPSNVEEVLGACRSFTCYNTTEELAEAATNGKENKEFEVSYEIEGKGTIKEATVHRVKNGIAVNYAEAYMRRRDPGTMSIADDKPTAKKRFSDKYGYPFSDIQGETFTWLKDQDLAVFFYFAGRKGIGSLGIAIAPANAGFFAMGLSM